MEKLFLKALPYLIAFFSALFLTLIFTPIVRRINTRLGMIDKPDARRVNKVPIPRGGGVALILGVLLSYSIFVSIAGKQPLYGKELTDAVYWKYAVLSLGIGALGFVDDLKGMKPKVKLLGQIVVAALAWWWADLGFCRIWPSLPVYVDCCITVFWIVGAINAFNLIDGLDGLASGLALIATMGMAGAIILSGTPISVLFYCAFAGGLLGFLRYNYNPANIFLGDCGSMYIGFTVSILPLISQEGESFLVSIAVPMLAMGVPVFDTMLAIIRRSLRHLINKRDATEFSNGKVMTADADHLHHRILRSVGRNQRKAAWILYLMAAVLVLFGLVGVVLDSRAAGLWLLAFVVAVVIIFKDMSRIELFDFGRLLNSVAHDSSVVSRRRMAKLVVPFYLVADVLALVLAFFLCTWALRIEVGRIMLRVGLPILVASIFFMLVVLRTYSTAWSRAMTSNYLRILVACFLGGAIGCAGVYYSPAYNYQIKAMAVMYPALSSVFLVGLRLLRGALRDFFYALDCSRLKTNPNVSRILVYGTGLRYRAFRRELVRTTAANSRFIVGLIDDDILLRNQYIGGVKIHGTINQLQSIIEETKADSLVIACQLSDEKLQIVRQKLASTKLKVSYFSLQETPLNISNKDTQGSK